MGTVFGFWAIRVRSRAPVSKAFFRGGASKGVKASALGDAISPLLYNILSQT